MPRQIIHVSQMRPLVIETPMGLIEIRWTGRQKRFEVLTPDGLVAHHSVERAVENGKFVARDNAGNIVPTWDTLMPVCNDKGALVGVKQPPVYRFPAAKTG